ncbi:MAG: AI-2E family transporter [Ruminococcaceae bacterium]|nr:AI-2E family transporter [Oscillospiraceae bacterium]
MGRKLDYLTSELKKPLIVVAFGVILFVVLNNLTFFGNKLAVFFDLFRPIITGLGIAFVLNLPMRSIEQRLLSNPKRWYYRWRRGISLTLTLLLAVLLLTALVWVVIPQLTNSISTLLELLPQYFDRAQRFVSRLTLSLELNQEFWNTFETVAQDWMSTANKLLKNLLPNLYNLTMGVTTGVYNLFLGLIVCIYLLIGKDKLIAQLKKLIRACTSKRTADVTFSVAAFTNETFRKFFAGQLTEAFILGVLCFIGMSIFRMPYALLISMLVGVTGVIPIFGAFIGAGVGAFIILMIHPLTALWFLVFIVVLQQLEGNIIYPRVVGTSIGLSGLWVLTAIIVGGGLFGFAGIFLGIPLMAVIYRIVGDVVDRRLQEQNPVEISEPETAK